VTDTLTPERRSENMRRIRSTGTSPELAVRRLVHGMGFRFRLHVATLPGKPDLVFPRLKRIIEVRGCFWHQHGQCSDSRLPKSRPDYWKPKLDRNTKRDLSNTGKLRRLGWKILVVWGCECEANRSDALARRLKRFLSADERA
jgi:DNA mismatch endonuclease (patch repair protein)